MGAAATFLGARGQDRRRARIEHVQWRRDNRRAAYAEFATAAYEYHQAMILRRIALEKDPDPDPIDPNDESYGPELLRVFSAQTVLNLEGPESVMRAASELVATSTAYETSIRMGRKGDKDTEDKLAAMERAVSTFYVAARQALDSKRQAIVRRQPSDFQ